MCDGPRETEGEEVFVVIYVHRLINLAASRAFFGADAHAAEDEQATSCLAKREASVNIAASKHFHRHTSLADLEGGLMEKLGEKYSFDGINGSVLHRAKNSFRTLIQDKR